VERTWQVTPGGSVQWGDWELVVTVRPASGLALHEVRWMGERVIYELSLSDAHAYYSGPSPGKQFHYSDKAYSLSQISADMVEGLDCPPGATFLNAATWISSWPNATYTYDPALAKPMKLACVFESPGWQGSSWRHTQLLNRHVTGRRGRMLVVRAVGTVGNYDYITEVRFGEDGHIHVGEDFAGYPEMDRQLASAEGGPSATPGRMLDTSGGKPEWGSTVHKGERPDQQGDNVQLLHAHFALFKVDLDVLGTSNDFLITRSAVSTEDGGLPKKVQVTKRVDREDNSTLLVANASAPGVWRVVNRGKLNARSGTPRGYAIQIGSSPAVQTLPRDHPFSIAGSFALRHLTVTKQKDEEPSGVHSLDFYALDDPIYSVDAFQADEESLVGQDLVCWVSIGKDHIGRTEDQPLVSNFGAYFTITPWDYHLENPQMQLDMMGKGPAEEVDLRFLTKTRP
jgi:primary-amine oxidase